MHKWKNILATHAVREILKLFNTVFLGIYFLKITRRKYRNSSYLLFHILCVTYFMALFIRKTY